ncbi:MAG TPA: hypothetical protein ENK91_09650 [Bacteroidetes bacterium]|nr:hypothetical protein [Bacteroidota bacterium]
MIDRLKDMVQSCNINFLFGSGMSAPYLSTLWNLETLLTDLHKKRDLTEDEKELIRVSIYKKFFDDVIEKNIDIIEDEEKSQQVLKSYKDFFSNINRLMLDRRNSLLSKQVDIFTTNIDVYLEKALEEKGFEFNDGFSGRFGLKYDLSNFKKSIYQSSLHYENSSEIPIFNVLKLHGSLTWKIKDTKKNSIIGDMELQQVIKAKENKPSNDSLIEVRNNDTLLNLIDRLLPLSYNDKEIKKFKEYYEKLVIINPTKEKFKDTLMNQIHYDLLRIYANELEKENTLLFVMGFSFADEHIRELTIRVANSNPTLQIIVFAYTKEAGKEIEENIDISKVRNNNIFIESPSTNEDCDYVYNFDTINKKIFKKQILDKIGISDE